MRRFILAIFALLTVGAAFAQEATPPATLVADSVVFSSQTQIISATGNVAILADGTRLKARAISYNGVTDQLSITGPLHLVDPDGTIIAADFASLSGDLQAGVLQSARLVYARQLQIAAAEIRRSEGRYTQFYKTVASSCNICEDDPRPLWELRSKSVVHDAQERQLYFEDAQLRVLDVPIFYSPYLRLPDPTVERATGFLVPELRSNGDIGIGVRTPYFIALNDHADLTLTPWLTSKGATTLEARYRRKFRFAEIEVNGAVTSDDLTQRDLRSYMFAVGSFDLPRNFKGKFDIELVSDPAYLLLYGYSEKDRLDSAVSVERISRDELINAELVHYFSLRADEDNRTQPSLVGDAIYRRRFADLPIGGIAGLTLEANGIYRRSNEPLDGAGRDVSRLSVAFDWRRDWLRSNGMIFAASTELRADIYAVNQDDRLEFGDTTEITPYAALEWRWPMLRRSRDATHLLEPTVQIAFAGDNTRNVANEDSLLVDFDEANLFRFNRFPGTDAQEQGPRINMGLTYTRDDSDGWSLGLTVGRVIRTNDSTQFSSSTGLDGSSSDWLLATHLKIGEKLDFINRALFDDKFSLSRNEMRLKWSEEEYFLTSTFAWLEADESEGRPLDTSELTLDGGYKLGRHWTLSSDLRYDFVNDRTTRAGVGLSYQNECARVDLSLSRRFTSSTILTPTTDFGLSVQLAGFGASGIGGQSFARSCNG